MKLTAQFLAFVQFLLCVRATTIAISSRQSGRNCKTAADCGIVELCYGSDGFDCLLDDASCYCGAPIRCSSSSECNKDSVCADDFFEIGYCYTCKVYIVLQQNSELGDIVDDAKCESPTNSSGASVCIDAKLLSHLPISKLVFKSHKRASVLCDHAGSCATRGHMVMFNGKAMMMGSYCKIAKGRCSHRVMEVNSPRMSRGMRVLAKTKGLEFTAFAAQKETGMEEMLLSTLMHMGM